MYAHNDFMKQPRKLFRFTELTFLTFSLDNALDTFLLVGASGVKQIRHGSEGTRPYHSNTFTGGSVMSIHEHSNNIRTVGMGEFIGVLNGVEFRTRHNDYRLNMPSKTSTRDKAIEPIPFPPVPEEVKSSISSTFSLPISLLYLST